MNYGLSASIYTRNVNNAFVAQRDIETGIVYVNAPTIGAETHLPFGGIKNTGNGHRESGRRRSISIPTGRRCTSIIPTGCSAPRSTIRLAEARGASPSYTFKPISRMSSRALLRATTPSRSL